VFVPIGGGVVDLVSKEDMIEIVDAYNWLCPYELSQPIFTNELLLKLYIKVSV